MIPTYFAGLVVLSALFARGDGQLRWLMFWSLFGASAAFQMPALGGASISPAVAFLPFVVLGSLRQQGASRWLQHLRDGEPGFWLLLLVLWGVIGSWFLPRLFLGEIDVLTIDRMAAPGEPAMRLAPLRPVSSNISQSAYAVGALLVFLSVRSLLGSPRSYRAFNDGVIVLAIADVVAALVNMAELYLGLPSLMDYVRNGGYAILNQSALGGLQRIYGTFPEASSFAGFTLPLFAYVLTLWRMGHRPVATGRLAAVLLVLLLLSTSSTGYAGLAIYVVLLSLGALWGALCGRRDPSLWTAAAVSAAAVVALCVLGLLRPQAYAPVVDFFEITLFGKLESESGLERGSWNLQAWTNFLETYGVGVGLGSARASSFPLVLLSNLGALGTAMFLLFLVVVYAKPGAPRGLDDIRPVVSAARHAVLAALIVSAISATVFDLGVTFYAWAAVACGATVERSGRIVLRGGQAA